VTVISFLSLTRPECPVWSGFEFEEKLRKDAPDVFKRFVEADPFPEGPV